MNPTKELSCFRRVIFVESDHSYLIDGRPSGRLSATGVLSRFTKEFDSDKVAARSAAKMGVSKQTVLDGWRASNVYSQELGTAFHHYAEMLFSRKIVSMQNIVEGAVQKVHLDHRQTLRDTLPALAGQIIAYYKAHAHLIPVALEMPIGDMDDTRVCGMVDMFCYNERDDTYELLDFKTNKAIKDTNAYGEYLLRPLQHLHSCELNKYTLQLSLYQYIIEKYTALKVSARKIIWLNSNNDSYRLFEVPYLQKDITNLLDSYTDSFKETK